MLLYNIIYYFNKGEPLHHAFMHTCSSAFHNRVSVLFVLTFFKKLPQKTPSNERTNIADGHLIISIPPSP